MPFPVAAGMGLVGAIAPLIKNKRKNDERQIAQQQKLTDIQSKANKEQADYEQQLGLQMWKDTNFDAQVGEMKKAGLSPAAMLAGTGGGGGATGAGVAGVGAGTASDAAATEAADGQRMGMALQGAQLYLLEAQRKNIEADTANKQAGAGKAGAETVGQNIENEIRGGDDEIRAAKERIVSEADKAWEDANIRTVERQIQAATTQEQLDRIRAEAAGAALENKLTVSKTDLTRAEINEVRKKIWKMEEDIRQGDETIAISKFKSEIEASYPGLDKVLGRTIDDTIQLIFSLAGKNRNQQVEQKKRVGRQ